MLKIPHLSFEITDNCNLDCMYCYNTWKMDGNTRTPFNSYKKTIVTLKKLFHQAEVKHITFTGGEPFLAERFLEVVLFCRMQGKEVAIISNGTIGSVYDYEQLIKMGVRLFEFPIHAAQASIHDQMTELKGCWEKSTASIQQVLNLGGLVVPVVVITKYNVNHISETVDFIKSLGCNRIMINRYNIGGKACSNPLGVSANAQELRKAFSIANKKSNDLGLIITSNVCTPFCLLHPKDYPQIRFGHCSTDVLKRPITMDIHGNVRLCNHSPIVAGNIFNHSIENILFSDYSKSWELITPKLCNNCMDWSICQGGCRAASEQAKKSLFNEDPIIKNLLQ